MNNQKKVKIESLKKTIKYRKKGLSYRAIAAILGSDVKAVWRWAHYDVGRIVDN